ncbi:MAG: hypothetical protein ACKOCM_11435 [Cyanobacteriota bacterium]
MTSATFSLTSAGQGDPGESRPERSLAGIDRPPVVPTPAGGALRPRLRLDPPILDLRDHRGAPRRWSARVFTLGLWAGGAWLMGAPLTAGLALAALPVLLSARRRTRDALPAQAAVAVQEDLPRQALAEAFGLGEATLFRARHARSSTLHYNDQGVIVRIEAAEPGASSLVMGPRLKRGRHAHSPG